ncbi:hypothetical protein [Gymnodinialimonas hymeniacidonis]|uniref:hypothetical protein n=1 Tax=Gymnodinialimonas hymeniacidonis TaxID=3126508 RepID=UPI0034C5C346
MSETIRDEVSPLAFAVLSQCIGEVANSIGQSAFIFPNNTLDGEYIVRLEQNSNIRPIVIEQITPGDVCTIDSEQIVTPSSHPLSRIDLECVNENPGDLRIAINLSVGSIPVIALPGERPSQNMRISVESFYSDADLRSWVLQEIQLFDREGSVIPFEITSVSSCFENCTVRGGDQLSDGSVAANNFWAPDYSVDSEGAWIELEHAEAVIERVRVVQWSDAGCMANCQDPDSSTVRANARHLLFELNGGAERIAVRLLDQGDQTVVLRN